MKLHKYTCDECEEEFESTEILDPATEDIICDACIEDEDEDEDEDGDTEVDLDDDDDADSESDDDEEECD